MQCPPEIARILAQILSIGLLRIRASGWGHDSARCAVEADHLHNLPSLLVDYDPGRLDYYWTAERVAFIEHNSSAAAAFEPLWNALAAHIPSAHDQELSAR